MRQKGHGEERTRRTQEIKRGGVLGRIGVVHFEIGHNVLERGIERVDGAIGEGGLLFGEPCEDGTEKQLRVGSDSKVGLGNGSAQASREEKGRGVGHTSGVIGSPSTVLLPNVTTPSPFGEVYATIAPLSPKPARAASIRATVSGLSTEPVSTAPPTGRVELSVGGVVVSASCRGARMGEAEVVVDRPRPRVTANDTSMLVRVGMEMGVRVEVGE